MGKGGNDGYYIRTVLGNLLPSPIYKGGQHQHYRNRGCGLPLENQSMPGAGQCIVACCWLMNPEHARSC